MGMLDNLGRVADTYIEEKNNLRPADEIRKRTFTGHLFWPHEALRDIIIFMSMLAVLLFYSYLIPPPLHSAADPMAQAGFVFPDWYVLFSYGYLRWGEYLPQFDVPLGPIGDFFGQPVYPFNASAWGVFLTGLPVGILALPPILGGTAKRGVEDPWFAVAGVVYLAHVWFISVFSINIFLALYGKNRTDSCKVDHGELICGVREPWLAELFNAIPWILTGILIWIVIYFGFRWFLVNSIGVRTTPQLGKQVSFAGLIIAVLISALTFPIYDNGFWELNGFGAMDDYETLDKMVDQPSDHLIEYTNEFATEGDLISAGQLIEFEYQDYQPTQLYLIDYSNENKHHDTLTNKNKASFTGNHSSADTTSTTGTIYITNEGLSSIPLNAECSYKASVRKLATITSEMTITSSSGEVVAQSNNCDEINVKIAPGNYEYEFIVTTSGDNLNSTFYLESELEISAFQPLMLYHDTGTVVNVSSESNTDSYGMVLNPAYHKNPKALDAKLIYTLVIPCITFGAITYALLRKMARGYEYEMNKCYGCDLCDDACPVRLFTGGDKLNIIYNTWNNEDDGVPMYTCLTCSACTNVCPQLVDYDSYVDIRRNMVIGGAPSAEIPHSILQAVLAAESEEDADEDFTSVEDYPIDSDIGYYPGCVDYIDREMIFSHLNSGEMNLGAVTDAAYTLFEEMDVNVSYLGRDFLKCCGHDQKWQGMTEVFEKLKSYNQKKLNESGIKTLVSSCAECFTTFAKDYELEDIKVMHTTEFLKENNFKPELKVDDEVTVTYHDPCRLGRGMGVYDEPRDLIDNVEGVNLVEMEHHGEDGLCCGVSSMMSCNENSRTIRVQRFEEVKSAGAEIMLTSCPKCVSHFECLKFEGDPRHDFEILDIVSFLARQVESKKTANGDASTLTTSEKVKA
mgnify:CR=1 FL=1